MGCGAYRRQCRDPAQSRLAAPDLRFRPLRSPTAHGRRRGSQPVRSVPPGGDATHERVVACLQRVTSSRRRAGDGATARHRLPAVHRSGSGLEAPGPPPLRCGLCLRQRPCLHPAHKGRHAMKKTLGLLLLLMVGIPLGFGLYLAATWSPLFRSVDILFYRGLLLCAARWRWKSMEPAWIVAAVSMSLSFNLMFLIVLPVTIDRSISVFLLAEIDARQASSPTDAAQLEQTFVQHYVHDMRQIDRRVGERFNP